MKRSGFVPVFRFFCWAVETAIHRCGAAGRYAEEAWGRVAPPSRRRHLDANVQGGRTVLKASGHPFSTSPCPRACPTGPFGRSGFLSRKPQTRFPSGLAHMRPTGFEPVTFGFVGRELDSDWPGGTRFQADFAESNSAEIGWTLCGTVPHFVPHSSVDRPPGSHEPPRFRPAPRSRRPTPVEVRQMRWCKSTQCREGSPMLFGNPGIGAPVPDQGGTTPRSRLSAAYAPELSRFMPRIKSPPPGRGNLRASAKQGRSSGDRCDLRPAKNLDSEPKKKEGARSSSGGRLPHLYRPNRNPRDGRRPLSW